MEMDPLAVVLPQYALEEALAENEARHEERPLEDEATGAATQDKAQPQERSVQEPSAHSPGDTATQNSRPVSSRDNGLIQE